MSSLNKEYKQARLTAVDGLQLSDRTYNLTIGLTVLLGLLINYLMYTYLRAPILSMNYGLVIILYLAGAFGGMFIVYKSDGAAASLGGFALLAAAMGLLLTHYLSYYSPTLINSAVSITAIVTGIMILLSTLFPSFFMGLGRILSISLLACIVTELVCGLIFRMNMDVMDWIVALIFCGYIGFDWAKAQAYPKTLNNAVDSAADIYVDVINLFVRVLEILGRSKRD